MVHADPLRAEWRGRNALRPIYRSMTMTEDGLVLGAGTMLALMEDLPARRGGPAAEAIGGARGLRPRGSLAVLRQTPIPAENRVG